jgi:hypothetical protein
MGPQKTGSTTLQNMSRQFLQELKDDGYYMPFDNVQNLWEGEVLRNKRLKRFDNQVEFATCFQPPHKRLPQLPCVFELLLAGLYIGKQGNNLLISAEAFDKSDDSGLEALAAYLSIFDETIVTVFFVGTLNGFPLLIINGERIEI